MLPNLDSLALFVRAAELQSLTKAASSQHLGLAAASRRITLLEHRFKTSLLERSPRGVTPTPAGQALLVHAKALLVRVNQMQVEMSDHAAGRKGALRVLANTSAMSESLPADLAEYAKANPEVRLVVEERWSAEIVKAIISAEADLGVIVEGQRVEGLELFPYKTDHIAVMMPSDHPLVSLENFRFIDILAHDIIALESNSSMMRLLAEQAVIAEQTLSLRIQVRSFKAVCRTVQSGLGVGILPYQAASDLCKGMGLIVRPLQEKWAERRMQICVRKERNANGSLDKLLTHLTEKAAQPCSLPATTLRRVDA